MSLYVEKMGEGPDIVFLHGWGMNSSVWKQVAEKLQKYYTVTLIDLPGFGRSANCPVDYGLSALAAVVADVINEDCALVGWSMGGIIAQQVALEYSAQVNKLVLVACNAQFVADDAWPNAMDGTVLAGFFDNLLVDYQATLHRFLMLQARGGENARQTVRELKSRVLQHGQSSELALREGLCLLQQSSFIKNLSQLTLPTLLMQGKRDTLVPSSCGEQMLTLLPQGRLVQFGHAAHAPFISHVDEFVDQLKIFLAGCGNSS